MDMEQPAREDHDGSDDGNGDGNEPSQIDTGGGLFAKGQISVGGDLIGRDQIVQGDSVQGDVIGGDKITVGDVSDSQGIAVGREASAEVHQTLSPQDAQRLFLPLRKTLMRHSGSQRSELKQLLSHLIAETSRGDGSSSRIIALIDSMVQIEPAAAAELRALLSSPPLATRLGASLKDVLSRLSD